MGPMQAIGGNRGASSYSSRALDRDIDFISQRNATAKSLLPKLSKSKIRDSGVYTESFNVNLRDQVRPDDTLPLQFRYLPADCRIYYTLSNAYNMSRLWRDVAAAAFDDPATYCIEGSTDFRNTTKAAPLPEVQAPSPLEGAGESSDGGFAYVFNEDDGIQDFGKNSVWGEIRPCPKGNTCPTGSQCYVADNVPCASTNQLVNQLVLTTNLCLWETNVQEKCGPNTVFRQVHHIPNKNVYEGGEIDEALTRKELSAGWTGVCWPTVTDPAWAGRNPACHKLPGTVS